MSYIDGRNVPGSHSPYTVWLRRTGGRGVVGVSFKQLNKRIDEYNKKRYSRFVDFWPWYSYQEFSDVDEVEGFSALWNYGNANMTQVHVIK